MFKLTLRNLAAHKARFAMTTFAVVLGVGFVVASFVLSDGLRSTFGDLSTEITDGTDLEVRPVSQFGEPIPLDESLIDQVAAIDGVRVAAGFVEAGENAVQPIKADGTTIDTFGPPQLMFSWIDDPELGSFTIVEGQPPSAPGEFTMDVDAASNNDFVLGGTYDLITPSGLAEDYELVGVTSFGADNDTVGATLMHVTLEEAQALFGTDGEVDGIPISLDDGADPTVVTAALTGIVPAAGAEIVDNATLTAEQQAEFDEGIDIIGNFLLGFAIVSLFVSIFIIYNTFSIVLGQRVRELGLMRAIGTGSRQIRRSVLGEALIVGMVASAVGIGAGVGLARALEALFSALGASLPESPTIVAARTIGLAIALGVGVTVVSALAPARAAGRVSPIMAMRDGAEPSSTAAPRVALGAVLVALGLVAGGIGLFAGVGTAALIGYLGLGAVAIFVGVTMTSPVIARPAARLMGWPIARVMGRSGHLARENAARNPRRTATTGAALMIGLSLVSAVLVVGESVKARLGDLIEESVSADYVMFDDSDAGFAPVLVDDLEATGQFGHVSAFRYDDALVDGEVKELTAGDLAAVPSLFDLDVQAGEIPTNGQTNVILMPVDTAEDLGVTIGDVVGVEFVSGASFELELAATYDETSIFESPLVSTAVFDQAGADDVVDWVGASLAPDVAAADAAPYIDGIVARYPQIEIQSAAEFQEQFEASIDSALTVVNAMLALAIVIALIGIANTLALSVSERTRELGLLRAVGMTRRQVRRMVRWEAALVASFGAVLGAVIGIGFGWAIVSALPTEFADAISVPAGRIVVLMAVATAAGLAAAALPARRAGRLDVLEAISQT